MTSAVSPPSSAPAAKSSREARSLAAAADLSSLPRAWGPSLGEGLLREQPEDFQVHETLAHDLSGDGEHLYLRVRKRAQNTTWVAREYAQALGLPRVAVGYAGLKDRHALTSQWFSLHLPGCADPVLPQLRGVEILQTIRHRQKLRIGALRANEFRLRLRNFTGDRDLAEGRLAVIAVHGVPNYFGGQRFGHGARNLHLLGSERMIRDRNRRSFGLSAVRSALFNGYLASRIEDGSWLRRLPGELAGHRDDPDSAGGLLWGEGDNLNRGDALAREQEWFACFPDTLNTLAKYRPRMSRRALRLMPQALAWNWQGCDLELRFSLGKGSYATAVVRELGDFTEPRQRTDSPSSGG